MIRNIAFGAILVLCMLSPALLMVLDGAGVKIPSWLSTEDAKYLSGGVTKVDIPGVLSVGGFVSGELQEQLEAAVGNNTPGKAFALLINASLQRGAIAASNKLFDWPVCPTFFGSDIVEDSANGRLSEFPASRTSEIADQVERTAKALEECASDHARIKFYLYLGPDGRNVTDAPAVKYMSNPMTYADYLQLFSSIDTRVAVIDGGVSYEEFQRQWYRTDHHWNIRGAEEAYTRIAEAMELPPLRKIVADSLTEYDNPAFYGSLTRRGLVCDYEDKILDVSFLAPPAFSIKADGKEVSDDFVAHLDRYESGKWNKNKFANRYAEYFHGDFGLLEIENNSIENGPSLLVIADSYSNCLERLFAASYKVTYVLDPRHSDLTVDGLLKEHDNISEVLVLMRSANLLSDYTFNALEGDI